MTEREKLQRMLKEHRLKHQLELQSQQIEKVFSSHQVSARVAGGEVKPRTIRFDLQAHLEAGWERLRHIKQDLLTVLGATLINEDGRWQVQLNRKEEAPVPLLDLITLAPEMPPVTAVLGIDEAGNPLLLEFSADDLTHMLISGSAGAGKTTLLRTIAVSLALSNRQSRLQLAVIGANKADQSIDSALAPLDYLPHMLAPVAFTPAETKELLQFMVDEVDYRQEQQMQTPVIILLVDDVVALMDSVGPFVSEAVTKISQHGPDVGIHLALTAGQPASEKLSTVLRANLPVRIVGRVADAAAAQAASDLPGTQAEYLLGEGDFVAVVGETAVHFQAAYIGDYDLHLTLETLQRNRPRPLLARPVNNRTSLPQNRRSAEEHFWFNEQIEVKPANGFESVGMGQL
ncbi:MAG TPA: hypothetical protein ENJ93_02295 [Chloroflexi bacterium]|nr:hypothetical protein [Chloroflexota bacterium]